MNKLRTILTWGLLLAATHVMGYTITVNPIEIEAGQSTNLIINLNNTETNLTAYQMKLFLPTGVTVQKKANGKYAYTSNADRLDPDLFTVTVKDAADGSVLIAVFSPDKDVIAGTSGELIRLPIDVASTVTTSLQGSLKEIEFTDVNNQAYNISDVNFTMTMPGSGTPDPGVVTGDVTVSVPDVAITAGSSTNLIINMQTGLTNLTAYQMKLYLPTGVTVQKKANGKYAYTSNADRLDPDLFTVTVKDAADGSVLIAVFSPDKDVIAGTSGELIRLPIDVASTVTTSLQGSLKEIEFTDVNNQAYNISDVNFTMTMGGGSTSQNISFADANVKAICVANWDTNHDGELSEAEAAAVTNLGEVFRGNTTITSFNELQYFIGLTSIGQDAFYECTGLTSVTIPNSVTSIGQEVFRGCNNLVSIIVENGNPKYDSRNNCNAILETGTNTLVAGCKNTIIPNSVTSIGVLAFPYISSLTSITIPNSVTHIGWAAFCRSGLTSISIPESVTSIDDYAFMGCSNLVSIIVENGNPKYDSRDNCNAIIETATNTLIAGCQNTIIPETVTSIGLGAFDECSNLTSITIPNSVTSIGEAAFLNCSNLTSITIPNSVTSIGGSAFNGCSGLTSVTIPNSVTNIGACAFLDCSSLTSITIPENVTSISEAAFAYCSNLTDVWCYAEDIPSTGNDLFVNTDIASATLHVPAASLEAYSTTAPWSGFGTIVPIEEAGIEVTDISQLENAIYIEPFSACMGIDKNIEVRLKNAEASTGYGFDLVLPEGISIAVDDEGSFNGAVTLSPRNSGATIATHKNSDNQYTIAVMSSTSVTGNDGLVLTVKTHVQDEMPAGTYPIAVKNSKITFSNLTQLSVPDTQTSVTVRDYLIGDVNGDGETDLLDAVIVLYHSVGKPVPVFIEAAGDVNNDNESDLLDAVMILYYSVGKIPSLDGFGTKGLDPQ